MGSLEGGGVGGGWVGGMLTFIGLAHLRDATLLHVLFNLHNYVMLRYCTFSSIYTTTWCYVDWSGWVGGGMLTLIGIGGITKTKSFAACSLTSTVLVPSCLKSLARSKSTDNGWVWRIFFPIFTEKWRLWWGQRWIHLCDVVVSNMCGDVISKLVHHWSCWKSWQNWWKTTTPTTAKRVEKETFWCRNAIKTPGAWRARDLVVWNFFHILGIVIPTD